MSDGIGISEIANKGQDEKPVKMWECPLCYKRCEYGTMGCDDPLACPEEKNIHGQIHIKKASQMCGHTTTLIHNINILLQHEIVRQDIDIALMQGWVRTNEETQRMQDMYNNLHKQVKRLTKSIIDNCPKSGIILDGYISVSVRQYKHGKDLVISRGREYLFFVPKDK